MKDKKSLTSEEQFEIERAEIEAKYLNKATEVRIIKSGTRKQTNRFMVPQD